MATFKATILKLYQTTNGKRELFVRADGKFNVKIRVTHNRRVTYISTPHYVPKSSLTKELELKDRGILKTTDKYIEDYEKAILQLGQRIHSFSAQELADWLTKETKHTNIDFIQFSQEYIDNLLKKGNTGNASNLQSALNNLKDFLQRDKISIEEITSSMLEKLEVYLSSPRTIKRYYKPGELVEREMPGIGKTGLHDCMRRLRQLFLAAQDKYNDPDKGQIKIFNYPFKKYKIPAPAVAKKRNLDIEQLKAIRDLKDIPSNGKKTTNLCELSAEIGILSFYLVGMNSADLYNASIYKKGRITYNRTKTKTRRKDEALISIKVEPEALPYFEKYKDPDGKRVFDFYKRYTNFRRFNKALNDGLKQVAALLIERGIEMPEKLDFYHFRGTWGSLAKNKLKINTDLIGFALNHIIQEHETTNLYIETDFSIIDEANRKVLDLIK